MSVSLSLLLVAPVIYVLMSLESTVVFKSNQTLDRLLCVRFSVKVTTYLSDRVKETWGDSLTLKGSVLFSTVTYLRLVTMW